jgi:hypothetical protein
MCFLNQVVFIPNYSIKIFDLPDRRAPVLKFPQPVRSERFPRMDYLLEGMIGQRTCQDMDMVVHDDIGKEVVA